MILLSLLAHKEAQPFPTYSADSEDVRYMVSALAELDIPHQINWDQYSLSIEGQTEDSGSGSQFVFRQCGATAMRPLTAVMTLGMVSTY